MHEKYRIGDIRSQRHTWTPIFVIIIIIDPHTPHWFILNPFHHIALIIFSVKSDFGPSSKDLLSEGAVFPDLVAGENLEVLPEQASQLQERLLVRGLVRPLHAREKNICEQSADVSINW